MGRARKHRCTPHPETGRFRSGRWQTAYVRDGHSSRYIALGMVCTTCLLFLPNRPNGSKPLPPIGNGPVAEILAP
jgi:hypothetical protein